MFNLLSLDAFQLTRYITRRFDRKLAKSDLNEIRDLSFQILGNKESFNSDSKSLLRVYYTLVKAYHNGILDNKVNKTFPYKHNTYVNYINNKPNGINGSSDSTIYTTSVANKHTITSNDDSDRVVDSCSEYMNKSINKIVISTFNDDFANTLNNYLHSVKDDRVTLLKLCIKLLIEFWTKNTLDTGLVNYIRDEINLNMDQITNDSAKHVSNLIEAYLLLILTKCYNDKVIIDFVKLVTNNFNNIMPQEKLKVFYGLSTVPENETVNNLLSTFLIHFQRNNRVLDKIVDFHLIPKFKNITIVDLFILLDSFVELDYRCSCFTRNIDSEYMKSLRKQDEVILVCLN
ncbi:hypothetical protein MACK_000554 [Theileria orientalis]|uniref:Uncharacterized protein n=1 Tax=Theileria orientalis TaxID=68886 RepID=A0A976MA60_THEOR|nr:hypothetical protein MACK_000554 [Theileria orientalis]